jgi:hypothetical protein
MGDGRELTAQKDRRLLDNDSERHAVAVLTLDGAVIHSTLMREVVDLEAIREL